MAFKTTSNRTHFRLTREVQSLNLARPAGQQTQSAQLKPWLILLGPAPWQAQFSPHLPSMYLTIPNSQVESIGANILASASREQVLHPFQSEPRNGKHIWCCSTSSHVIDLIWATCDVQMAYNIDVPKTSVAEALEILVDSVVNPKFLAWEVKEAVEKMKGDLQTVKDNPQTLLMEAGPCLPHTLPCTILLSVLSCVDLAGCSHRHLPA